MSNLVVGSAIAEIAHSWPELVGVLQSKKLLLQFVESATAYRLFALEAGLIHTATLYKADSGVSGVAEENADWLVEFELHYRDDANKPLESRSSDGRVVTRTTIASPAARTHQRAIAFRTSDPDSLRCHKPDGTAYADTTLTLLDADGNEATDPADAVETVVDFEPSYDQELVGGCLDVDPTLVGGATDEWWVYAVAAPTIPEHLGGSVVFVNRVNVEAIAGGRYRIDGRSTQFMAADPTYHSNRIRFAIVHPAGASKRFQFYVETFK